MTPTDFIYSLGIMTIACFLAHGASNWALVQHHNRVEAKARAQIWVRAARAGAEEVTLTIKKEDEE